MLGKLLKYENKVLSKILFPLGIGVLLVSLFGTLMMKLYLSISYLIDEDSLAATMIRSGAMTLFVFSVIAIISASFVSIFILMQRYYKSMFTDEGYLTFTLPVKTRDILLSKMLAAVLWTLFTVACTVFGVILISLFGSTRSFVNPDVLPALGKIWRSLLSLQELKVNIPLLVVQMIIFAFASLCEQFMLIFLAITLGNQVAKKHKVLGAIGMYFALYAIIQTINSALTIPLMITGGGKLFDMGASLAFLHWSILGTTLLALGYSAAFFAINRYNLKNKLNLE